MMEWIKNNSKYVFIIPAVAAFLLAMIPTLKYQWPLSWDIIYHIQYAEVYAQYGITLTNPLLNAPIGQKIGYPPLFHLILAGLGTIFKDYFQVARFLQPIIVSLIVLSTSYVGYKIHGKIAGISAGFLILTSIIFVRMIFPIPENIALVFFPIAVYLFYKSLKDSRLKFAVLSGVLLVLMAATHTAATLCLFITISAITLSELILYQRTSILKNFAAFILALIVAIILGALALFVLSPDLLHNILQNGFSGVTGIATSLSQTRPLSWYVYISTLGIPLIVFGALGSLYAFKNHEKKDVFLLVWLMAMILLSVAYLFGINVISYRVLIYILIPLSILGGWGIKLIYSKIKSKPWFASRHVHIIFLIVLMSLCLLNGFLDVNDPEIAIFKVENSLGGVQIAPPSSAEVDLANWFQKNGKKTRSIISNNQFTGMFISTQTGTPLNYNFNIYAMKDSPQATLANVEKEGIGYIIYDKKLVLSPPDTSRVYVKKIPSEFYSLDYFSQDIPSNLDYIMPSYANVVYENQEFIVCEIVY
jgi:hypothetical protein